MFEPYINLRNDIIFKIVFGYEKNEKILISLLNAILNLEGDDKIKKVTFLNTLNIKEYLNDKLTSLDVKVTDGTGKRYNIEMQVAHEISYIKRIIYYHDKLYTGQLKNSEDYDNLNKSISISILDFVLLKEEKDVHNIYRYLNTKSKKELTDLKEIHFIELPKFNKKDPDKLKTSFDKWVYTIKYGEEYVYDIKSIPSNLKEEEIVLSISEMIKAGENDKIREIMELKEKSRLDEISRMNFAIKKATKEAVDKGIEKGKLETLKSKLIRLLNKKFQELPKEIEGKILNCTDINKLDLIIDNIFDISSLDEVIKFLN